MYCTKIIVHDGIFRKKQVFGKVSLLWLKIWDPAFGRTISDFLSLIKTNITWRKKQVSYFFRIFEENLIFQKVLCFTVKWSVWLILDLTWVSVLSMKQFQLTNICQASSGSVLMNCWREPLCWSLIFCQTYKIIMWYVMCDVWCMMCDVTDLIFVRSWLFESRGYPKYPIWVISDLLSDILKLIPGGSCM